MSVTECAGLRAKALACALWPENQPNQPHALTPPGKTPMTYCCDHVIDWAAQGEQKNTLTKRLSHISEDTDVTFFDNSLFILTVSWFVADLFQWRLICFWSLGKDTGSPDLQQGCLMTTCVTFWKNKTWMFEMSSIISHFVIYLKPNTINYLHQ